MIGREEHWGLLQARRSKETQHVTAETAPTFGPATLPPSALPIGNSVGVVTADDDPPAFPPKSVGVPAAEPLLARPGRSVTAGGVPPPLRALTGVPRALCGLPAVTAADGGEEELFI